MEKNCINCKHSYIPGTMYPCKDCKRGISQLSPLYASAPLLWQSDSESGKEDVVNHPKHYETGKFECIDVMIETQGVQAVINFCICNAFKYIYRHNFKNNLEDVKKAKWYIDKAIELEEKLNEVD